MKLIILRLFQILEKIAKTFGFSALAQKFNDKKHLICKKIIFAKFSSAFFKAYDINNCPLNKIQKNVFVFWYQDLAQAPEIIKICLDSQQRRIPADWKLHIITKTNLNDYIDLPSCIMDKVNNNIISLTMLSDIVRFKLLHTYGGLRMDATTFLSGNSFFNDIERMHFYTVKGCFQEFELIHGGRTCFFIASCKGNLICKYIYDCFEKWFTNNEKPLTYLMVDCFMSLGYDNVEEIRKEIDNLESINSIDSRKIFLLNDYYLSKSYNIDEMKVFLGKESVHKLSYKCSYITDSKSCYSYIKNIVFKSKWENGNEKSN